MAIQDAPTTQAEDLATGQTTGAQAASANTTAEKTEVKPASPTDKKVYKLESFRSGWTQEPDYPAWGWQGRAFDQGYVHQLCANTKRMMAKSNLKIPVILNHANFVWGRQPEQTEASQGWVLDCEVRELEDLDPYGEKEVVLVCTVELEGELREDFDAGRLPKRSIWWDEGKLPNGRSTGFYLKHLALLGAMDQPAFPSLQDAPVASAQGLKKPGASALAKVASAFQGMINKVTSLITTKTNKLNKQAASTAAANSDYTGEVASMTTEEIEKLQACVEYLDACQQTLAELIATDPEAEVVEGEEEEVVEDETAAAGGDEMEEDSEVSSAKAAPVTAAKTVAAKAKTASAKPVRRTAEEIRLASENEALKKAAAKVQSDAALATAKAKFGELVAAAQIAPGKEKQFLKIATTNGLDFAVDALAGEVPTPNTGGGSIANAKEPAKTKAAEMAELRETIASCEADGYTSTATYRNAKARYELLEKAGN